MKKTILLLALMLASTAIYAQNDMQARIELEDAERAYSENRFTDALRHCDKTQQLLGNWSHQIAYFRILSLDKLCDYADTKSANFTKLQTETKKYIDYANANPGKVVTDKFREVYAISSKAEKEQQAQVAWARINPEDNNAVQSFMTQYGGSAIAEKMFNLKEQQKQRAWAQVKRGDKNSLQAFIAEYAGTPEAALAQKELEFINKLNLEMVFVEGGSFNMDKNYRVTLSNYYIGKYEVTQAQWRAVMGNNPSKFKGDDLPIETVSWKDVQEFIGKLNQLTGKRYRLPTEAEWEFAARGGNQSKGYKYSGSDNYVEVAWTDSKKTYPVGQKKPNELGIYDMSGNVIEWCYDFFGKYPKGEQINPKGASSGNEHILRGGGACANAYYSNVDWRGQSSDKRGGTWCWGFRLACDVE